MKYGLTDIDLSKLYAVFSKYSDIENVVLYGSRAKGNYQPFSDVDITVRGNMFTRNQLYNLTRDIDDLLLPYLFDVSIFHNIKNADLFDHIQRVGITIYEKNNMKLP